jgi:hypothetical protein
VDDGGQQSVTAMLFEDHRVYTREGQPVPSFEQLAEGATILAVPRPHNPAARKHQQFVWPAYPPGLLTQGVPALLGVPHL